MYDAIQFERQCRSYVVRFEEIVGDDGMVNIIDVSRTLHFILLPGLAHSQGRDGYNFLLPRCDSMWKRRSRIIWPES